MGLLSDFTDEVRKAAIDTMVLRALRDAGERGVMTLDMLSREVHLSGIETGDEKVEARVDHLERKGVVRQDGGAVWLTEEGRKQVEQVLPWLRAAAGERVRAR